MSECMLSPEDLEKVVSAVMHGATVAQAAGISKDVLEGLYGVGRNLYASGNYADARTIFQALSIYDASDYRFWMGLGGSCQALEAYEAAVDAYQMASVATSLKNPEPLFYAVKCLLRMNRKEDAVAGLQGLLATADKTAPEHAAVLDKAKALLELLQKEAANVGH